MQPRGTASSAFARAAAAWTTALSPREQEILDSVAGPVLTFRGYPRRFPDPRAQHRLESIGTWLRHNPVRRRWVKAIRPRRRTALLAGR
jgi:hypothetical protein